MEDNSLDIVIINFNSTDYTIRCIDSLYASIVASYKLHVIVIDNASLDCPERIKQTYPGIDLILNNKNTGFAKAVNAALNRSFGDNIILLNPDTLIYDGLIEKVIKYINVHKDVGVVGPRVTGADGALQGSARRFPTAWTSLFGRKSPLTRLFPNNPITKKEFVCFNSKDDQPIDVDWVSGACMIIKRKALDEVGGFDERYFMYWEDADFCKQLKDKGWRVVYFPEAKICHYVGKSSDTQPITSILNFHKSCYLLCEKHTNGLKRSFIPLVAFALTMRCLFVMGLNFFLSLKKRCNGQQKTDTKLSRF